MSGMRRMKSPVSAADKRRRTADQIRSKASADLDLRSSAGICGDFPALDAHVFH
jgi:hypothetical protein